MFFKLKLLMYAYLFGMLSFLSFADAQFEATGHFGIHAKNAIYIGDDYAEGRGPFILGGDVLYRFVYIRKSTYHSDFVVGLRYQNYQSYAKFYSSENYNGIKSHEDFKFAGNRFAILLGSRMTFTTPFFIGFIYSIDIWRSITIKQDGDKKFNESEWIGFLGQFAAELGFKFTPYLLAKLELGYNLLRIDKPKHHTIGPLKPYLTIGISYTFNSTNDSSSGYDRDSDDL